nr:TPA_asm: 37 kDa protein [Holcus ophiovirus]
MSFMIRWAMFIEPVLCRALSIIPHVKEIINIAFKPFNGINELNEQEIIFLRNRIEFIDKKFDYFSSSMTGTISLDSESRMKIIEMFNEKLKVLEGLIIKELIVPSLVELSCDSVSFELKESNLLNHYSNEMKQSFALHEKEFFISPIKDSIIRSLESGLDYFLQVHPRRTTPREYMKDRYITSLDSKIDDDHYGMKGKDNSAALDLIGLITFTWNKMGIKEDHFLTQFSRDKVMNTYDLAFPRGCCNIVKKHNGEIFVLDDVFDKLIIEISTMLRLYKTTSEFDDTILSYLYPQRPIEREVGRIRAKEAAVIRYFSVLRLRW